MGRCRSPGSLGTKVFDPIFVRLLQPKYSRDKATEIARHLVHQYPAHDFFINLEETEAAGLDSVEEADGEVEAAIEEMGKFLQNVTYIGKLEEITQP